jgi:hypothetical protein
MADVAAGTQKTAVSGLWLRLAAYSKISQREHRSHHRKVLQVHEPKPDPRLVTLYREHGTFVPVPSRSPHWLRSRLAGLATMFQHELGYNFSFYIADNDDCENEGARGPNPSSWNWIIVTADGRVIGGLSACWIEPNWHWTWVWVVPSERHAGHTQRCWNMLKAKLPGIEPDPPFSLPIARFFVRTDVPAYIRARCTANSEGIFLMPQATSSVRQPQSLPQPLPSAGPFPLDALGPELAEAAQAINDAVPSAAIARCASAALASASLAASAHVNIKLPTGQAKPVSCWFWSVGESREPGSSIAKEAFAPQRRREEERPEDHPPLVVLVKLRHFCP